MQRWLTHRSFVALLIACILPVGSGLLVTEQALAQGFQPPSPEESFRRMDQNGNGQIDPEEIQRMPSFIRDMYTRIGVDVSRPISQRQFMDVSQKMREQFDQMRSSGGGGFSFRGGDDRGRGGDDRSRGSFGGGPPGGSFGGGPPMMMQGGPPGGGDFGRGFGPRPEDGGSRDSRRDESSSDRRRREEEENAKRGGSSSSSRSSKEKKPKLKVTKELPDDYRVKDKNSDGQVALYEWDRSLFAQFYELDRNNDGFLTPDELIPATTKSKPTKPGSSKVASYKLPSTNSSSNTSTSTAVAVVSGSRPETGSTTSTTVSPATPDNPQAATAFSSLDVNKDGQITQDEWERSRNTRRMFERANVTVSLPIKQSQFFELYAKAQSQ